MQAALREVQWPQLIRCELALANDPTVPRLATEGADHTSDAGEDQSSIATCRLSGRRADRDGATAAGRAG